MVAHAKIKNQILSDEEVFDICHGTQVKNTNTKWWETKIRKDEKYKYKMRRITVSWDGNQLGSWVMLDISIIDISKIWYYIIFMDKVIFENNDINIRILKNIVIDRILCQ